MGGQEAGHRSICPGINSEALADQGSLHLPGHPGPPTPLHFWAWLLLTGKEAVLSCTGSRRPPWVHRDTIPGFRSSRAFHSSGFQVLCRGSTLALREMREILKDQTTETLKLSGKIHSSSGPWASSSWGLANIASTDTTRDQSQERHQPMAPLR